MENEIQLIVNGMLNLDEYLLLFIKNNFITMGIILAILKIIAIEAKCATGNKIIELLTNLLPKKNK